jgi:hypothetical protein
MLKGIKVIEITLFFSILIICMVLFECFLWLIPLDDPFITRKVKLPHYIKYIRNSNLTYYTESENGLPGMNGHLAKYSTNNIGFRGPDYYEDADSLNIFFIGGSTTEDLNIDDSLCSSFLLQEELRKAISSNIKVFNAGISGTTTQDHIEMIALRILHLNPKLIIIYVGFNDHRRMIWGTDYTNSPLIVKENYFSLKMLATEFQLFRRYLRLKNNTKVWFGIDSNPETLTLVTNIKKSAKNLASVEEIEIKENISINNFEKNINTIIGMCMKNNVPVILETHPSSWNSKIDSTLKNYTWLLPKTNINGQEYKISQSSAHSLLERMNNFIRNQGVKNQVFIHDLSKITPKSSTYFFDDCHFNINGAKHHSKTLFDFIIQRRKMIFNI